MTKSLRNAIMLTSKFRNRFLKKRRKNLKVFIISKVFIRSISASLLRKTKRNCYAQLDNKIVIDNRKFWKAVSPLFSEKTFRKESIILKEHGKTITNNKK